jgi:hypothetical protein
MRVLPAVRSARWRSWVGSILDHSVDVCFDVGHRLLALRERIEPTDDGLSEERVCAIIAAVNAKLIEHECVVPPPCACTDTAWTPSAATVVLPWQGGRH